MKKIRELKKVLFTEYPGHLGFAPAVMTIAVCLILGASLVYGGIVLGKAAFAHAPIATTDHS